jgi:DNA-binding transcriptional LysR family regulator
MPNILARRLIMPLLPEFMARHPNLELEISSTDRRVDLLSEGFDCVVRIGAQPDQSVVAALGDFPMINCASPAYLNATACRRRWRIWRSIDWCITSACSVRARKVCV